MKVQGMSELEMYFDGESLTLEETIAARCAACLLDFPDGPEDCHTPLCPLYPFQPYRKGKRRQASVGGDGR